MSSCAYVSPDLEYYRSQDISAMCIMNNTFDAYCPIIAAGIELLAARY